MMVIMAEAGGITVSALGPQVLELCNDWHRVNYSAWIQIPFQLSQLKSKLTLFQSSCKEVKVLRMHELSLKTKLKEVHKLLEEEEKLRDRRNLFRSGSRFRYKLGGTLFPATLVEILKDINLAYDTLLLQLKDRKGQTSFNKIFAFPVNKESLITNVPLQQQLESRITQALEDKVGPAVILLHGQPGTGKSTIAKQVGASYTLNFTDENLDGPPDGYSAHTQILPKVSNPTRFKVVFLECGRDASSRSKQLELLQKLDPRICTKISQDHEDGDLRNVQTEARLQQAVMKESHLLIILDDVWDEEFLKAFVPLAMAAHGGNVKFLVTSRNSALWDMAAHLETQETVSSEDAEKIFASHSGLLCIPPTLKEVAIGLIDRTGRHPLALAMLAKRSRLGSRMGARNSESGKLSRVGEWNAVADSCTSVLREDPEVLEIQGKAKYDLRSVLDTSYKRSIGETLASTYRNLKPEARRLLLLIANCAGPSVPNHVVQMLYCSVIKVQQEDSALYLYRRNQLEEDGVNLQVNKMFLRWWNPIVLGFEYCVEYETLALHDLQREFLNLMMREDAELLMESLLVDTPVRMRRSSSSGVAAASDHHHHHHHQTTIPLVLSALYLRKEFAQRAARKLETRNPLCDQMEDLRTVLGPIVFLLQEELYDKEVTHSAKQFLVNLVCFGRLDDHNLARLLTFPSSGPGTISAMLDLHDLILTRNDRGQSLADLDDKAELHVPKTIGTLLEFLQEDKSSPRQNLAVFALGTLAAVSELNRKKILESRNGLKDCYRLMLCSTNTAVPLCIVRTLHYLSAGRNHGRKGRRMVGKLVGIISKLVTYVFNNENPHLQESASSLLCSLSVLKANEKQIMEVPGAVEDLVKLLCHAAGIELLINVTSMLARMTFDSEVRRRIGEAPEAIFKLLTYMFRDDIPQLQETASSLLNNLSLLEANEKQIMKVPGAREELVRLLLLPHKTSQSLQPNVASMLGRISGYYPDVRKRIGDTPGAISKLLVYIFTGDNKLPFQEDVSLLLLNLAEDDVNTEQIMAVPGALEELMKLVFDDRRPFLQGYAARILGKLSHYDSGVRRRIGGTPRAISKLLSYIFESSNLPLQEGVSFLLLNLAEDETNGEEILKVPHALEELMKLLFDTETYSLQKHAVLILGWMSKNDPEVRRRIGETPDAISKLLTYTFKGQRDSLAFQESVSLLLRNLAVDEANGKRIMAIPGALEQLVTLLFSHNTTSSSVVKQCVADILGRMSEYDSEVRRRIGETPEAISKLLTYTFMADNPSFQESVSMLLMNLAADRVIAEQVMTVAGAVDGLITLLFHSSSTEVKVPVAKLLGLMSMYDSEVRRGIGNTPQAISKLLVYILQSDSLPFQESVSFLLSMIAEDKVNGKKIMEVPGSLEELMSVLFDDTRHFLQTNVVRILCWMSKYDLEVRRWIGEYPGTISKLVQYIFEGDDLSFLESVIFLLRSLATNEGNAKRILATAGALDELLSLLSPDASSDMRRNVSALLKKLAKQDSEVRRRIEELPN